MKNVFLIDLDIWCYVRCGINADYAHVLKVILTSYSIASVKKTYWSDMLLNPDRLIVGFQVIKCN